MKKISALLLAAALAASQTAQAAPVSVLLHPDGALVQEEETFDTDKDRKTLHVPLPASADLQSLDISVPGHTVTAFRLDSVLPVDSAPAAAWREKLNAATRDVQELQNKKTELASRRTLWHYPPVRLSSSEGLEGLAALTEAKLAALTKEGLELDTQLQKRQTEAEFYREQLKAMGSNATPAREAVVELAEPASGPVRVRYAYTLDAAGWKPTYRIEALPDEEKVKVTLAAELWQQSGDDWSNVPLTLTTANPGQGMIPPDLSDWVVRPRPEMAPRTMARASNDMMLSAPAPMQEFKAQGSAAMPMPPVYTDGTSFESWDMGRRTVPAGPTMRLMLDQDTIKADFAYLIRPSRSETAFLSAKLDLPELRHLPAGEALFLVDGVTVGKAPFSLVNDDRSIYFGSDPQVSAVMKKGSQQSGKEGIIDRKQTYAWDWTITVFNKHNRPVTVRVEDPAPQSGDAQIALTIVSKPEAKKEDDSLVWNLNVPAGKSSTIRHAVSFTAPTDMKVWEGR